MAMVDFNTKSPNLEAVVAPSFLRISVSQFVQLASVHSAQTGRDCRPVNKNTAKTFIKEI